MNEIANATTGKLSVIDGLAMQARALRLSINVNMWQLARVFIEAKELVPHGEWGKWLKDNADVGERTAQDMMAAYKRFGGKAPFEGLTPTQTFKLLPLPEGSEEQFMAEHDVQHMSTREIQEAVKQARAEAQAEIDRERQARLDAEQRAMDAENRVPEIPKELTEELKNSRERDEKQRAEIERLAEFGNSSLAEQRRLASENNSLRQELKEQEDMLREQQEALNQAQEELLNLQSAQARGEEHAYTDELTADVITQAAREFIGLCARGPHMHSAFAAMDWKEKQKFAEVVAMMREWVHGMETALDTVAGGVVIE